MSNDITFTTTPTHIVDRDGNPVNEILLKHANRVAEHLPKKTGETIIITTVLSIIGIIVGLVQIWQKCHPVPVPPKPTTAQLNGTVLEHLNSPNFWDRVRLAREIRRHPCDASPSDLKNAFLIVGPSVTKADVDEIEGVALKKV